MPIATSVFSILAAVAATIYFHPGTKHDYISYMPGIIGKVFYGAKEFKEVIWRRSELPISEQSDERNDPLNQDQDQVYSHQAPNVILILADDLGFNDLSGGAGVETPNIDALKQSGVNCEVAYAGHATCSPARASLLTGRYPSRFGYEFTAVPWQFSWVISRPLKGAKRQPIFDYPALPTMPPTSAMNVPIDEIMLPKYLKQQRNYSTVYLGKWHLGSKAGYAPWDRGFDETLGFLGAASLYFDPSATFPRYSNQSKSNSSYVVNAPLGDAMDDFLFNNLRDIVRHNGGTHYFSPQQYMTDYLSEQAVSCIKTKLGLHDGSNRKATIPPLFMYLSYNAPHTPLQAKREDYDALSHISDHKQRVYAAMIKALDRGIGQIVTALKEINQYENTMIIFTSDNGGPSYLGMPHLNHPFRGWKATFYEGGVRVPFIMSWPNVIPAGIRFNKPVSHVDIFATVAAAAGAAVGDNVEACSSNRNYNEPVKLYDGVNLLDYFMSCLDKNDDNRNECVWNNFNSGTRPRYEPQHRRFRHVLLGNLNDPHDCLYWRTGHYIALRCGHYKLQVSERPDRVILTNLSSDSTERKDLLKGAVLWTGFNDTLHSSAAIIGGHSNDVIQSIYEACSSFESKCVQSFAMQKDQNPIDSSIWTISCMLGRILLIMNSEQTAPLWPALTETPVPIDRATYGVLTQDEDYVYWVN